MRKYRINLLLAIMLLLALPAMAQIHLEGYNQQLINPQLLSQPWKARWICAPNEDIAQYGVYHFRKTIQISSIPESYVVHVSADNRYKLYVNGQLVLLGPARSDIKNWHFETVDLKPYLREGDNVLAAVVWNASSYAPVAQMSSGSAIFIVQGNTEAEYDVNTNRSWKVMRNKAYTPNNDNRVQGYYAAGATDKVDANLYPFGWETLGYDDSAWAEARTTAAGTAKGAMDAYGLPLVPSPIPQMELSEQRLSAVRLTEGNVTVPADFLSQPTKMTIPANSEVRLILDNKVLTTGYLNLVYSKGQGSTVKLGYAESLYEKNPDNGRPTANKGNRDEVDGKLFVGYQDIVLPDGGDNRTFTPLWWRTWRYVELTVNTADQPLEINDLYGTFEAYPFELASSFSAPGNELYDRLIEVGWRTARLCAHETYMDCPYYEQLMYFGDTRIQTMLSLYNTHDQYMVRNAIEMGRQSMNNEGITLSRYPDNLGQIIPSYSLSWIGMIYDYWMMRGDEGYLKTLMPAVRSILGWYESFLKNDYSLKNIPFWYFCDWSEGFQRGVVPREDDGNSAMQDLNYLLALDEASKLERAMGIEGMADHYDQIASKIREGFNAKYWDANRQLYADTHDHRNYSQHSNILAILAGVIEGDQATDLCRRILSDDSLNQATIYFQYYLHMAMDKAGLADELLNHIQTYTDLFNYGLTTCMEEPEPSRSDCHAWSASMNIEFLRMVLGVHSAAPAFGKVLITPAPGALKEVSGSVPCPQGDIKVSYKQGNKLEAEIELPQGLDGTLVYHGKSYDLRPGLQKLSLE